MREWTTALPDWRERILTKRSLIPDCILFPEEAAAAGEVLRQLRIVDMAGSPMIGDVCRRWVLDFCDAVFGSYDAESGQRLIQEFFLLVSKKNSKSTIAAAIMLTALIRNWRLSGEFLIIAPTIKIAGNSFDPIRDMIKADPELDDLLKVQDHLRLVTHTQTGATLRVLAADTETVAGNKAIGLLVDELWLFGKKANADRMLREAAGGLMSRPEGFVIHLSTQSDEPPAGVFKSKLDYFRGVRDGRIVDRKSLGVLYEFPESMIEDRSYKEPGNFYITNPNLGASVYEAFLLDQHAKALIDGEAATRDFFAKHLNVEIGLALQSDRWAGADFWEERGDHKLTMGEVVRRSEVVTIGIDGGGLDDLLGVAVLGRERDTDNWLLWTKSFVAPIGIQRRKSEETKYREFEMNGDLVVVNGLPDDIKAVMAIVEEVDRSGRLVAVGVDRIGIGGIIDALAKVGITIENGRVESVNQGYMLSGSIKTMERKLADGTLIHAGQPIMAWAIGNARVEPKGNAITITKQAAGHAKIDPLIASFNAVSLMERTPQAATSIYEKRGLLVL